MFADCSQASIYLKPSLSIIDESQHYFQHCWFFDDHQFYGCRIAATSPGAFCSVVADREGPGDSVGELVARIAVKSMARADANDSGDPFALPLMATKIDALRLPSGVRLRQTVAGAGNQTLLTFII